MPLHPALVHVPLAAAAILPGLALAVLIWPKRLGVPWSFFPIAQLLLCASLYGVMAAGQSEAELVLQAGFRREILDRHADLAELSVLVSLGVLLPAAWAVRPGRSALARRCFFVLAQLALAFIVVWTGREGGRLVYEHDAPRFRMRTPGAAPLRGIELRGIHRNGP